MITATLLSFSASLVLGVAALKNGSKATQIAKEASDRDELHRKLEFEARGIVMRNEVAMSMLKALASLEQYVYAEPAHYDDWVLETRQRFEAFRIEALAHIDVHEAGRASDALRNWFTQIANRAIADAKESVGNQKMVLTALDRARNMISRWNRGALSSIELQFM